MSFIAICLPGRQEILKMLKENIYTKTIHIKHIPTKYMKICFQLSGYMHFPRMKIICIDLKQSEWIVKDSM